MDPQPLGRAGRVGRGNFNGIGVFVQHARAHAFQHGQRVRQRHLAGAVDLEAQQAGLGIHRAVQFDRQWRMGGQARQNGRVFSSHWCGKVVLVGTRVSVGKSVCQRQARALSMGAQQFGRAVIFPALGQSGDAGFQRRLVHVVGSPLSGAYHVVNAGHRAVGEHGCEFDGLAIQCGHQLPAHLDAQLGVVAVARHKHLC